jgi:hypothetical protein
MSSRGAITPSGSTTTAGRPGGRSQLAGGVSERFVREQLWTWMRDPERVRDETSKRLRKAAGSTLH